MMKIHISHSRKGFTLIELLVGMMIFSVGITGIFVLLQSTMRSVSISRSEIVVANLLREQMELIRHRRDENMKKFAPWDAGIGNHAEKAVTVENDFSQNATTYNATGEVKNSGIKITSLSSDDFPENEENDHFFYDKIKNRFEKSKLCLDEKNRFVHCSGNATKETPFASYLRIKKMRFDNKDLDGYTLDARVIVRDGNHYREYDAKTAITHLFQ